LHEGFAGNVHHEVQHTPCLDAKPDGLTQTASFLLVFFIAALAAVAMIPTRCQSGSSEAPCNFSVVAV
jgi:hypothetical protein